MNIFKLDSNPRRCATYHHDKHCNKMLTESVQMQCTTYWYFYLHDKYPYSWFRTGTKEERKRKKEQYRAETGLFCPTHINHPCNVWLRESYANWVWLNDLVIALASEWKYRFNQIHKSFLVNLNIPMFVYKNHGITQFALAMPDKYKQCDCQIWNNKQSIQSFICPKCKGNGILSAVEAYRRFYIAEKLTWTNKRTGKVYNHKWTKRSVPYWIKEGVKC